MVAYGFMLTPGFGLLAAEFGLVGLSPMFLIKELQYHQRSTRVVLFYPRSILFCNHRSRRQVRQTSYFPGWEPSGSGNFDLGNLRRQLACATCIATGSEYWPSTVPDPGQCYDC